MRAYLYILFFFLLACKPKELVLPEVTEAFEIIVPTNYVTAGSAISIQLINEENYQGDAQLIIESPLTKHVVDFNITDELQDIDLDGSYIIDAGLINAILLVGNQIKDQKTFRIKSSDIISPIELFTGPMTIWVNNIQESMVVALPKDEYANAGREGDAILFQSRHPDGNISAHDIRIEHQLAYKKLNSEFKSGKVFIGTSEEESGAKEQRVDVIPLWPNGMEIEVVDHIPYADNRQFYKLTTDVLKDINGDVVSDGTLVHFIVRHKRKSVSYNSYSIDGVANVYIRNPSYASRWFAKAVVGDQVIVSNTVTLDFETNVKSIPIELINDAIIVGPIASYIGQFIPDGTQVRLKNNGTSIIEESEDGMVKFEKPQVLSQPQIIVGGVIKEITYDQ